jgi:1,2-diacylglycerol 3-beta-glucosyltransferase
MATLCVLLVGSIGLVVVGSMGYLLVLLAAAAFAKRALRQPVQDGGGETPRPRITVVIPAHDEELVLAETLGSLAAQQYPRDRFSVVVVADNCTDATAMIARERRVRVLERVNTKERGKGYALGWAMARLLAGGDPAEAFVVVDADTWIAPDFLGKMAARLLSDRDERGYCALQGRYGVLNSEEGWRAALMGTAFDLCNHVKLLGQARLGLSVGLKGNGMAFTRPVLERARWRGESITEDIDYGLDLLQLHRIPVGYVPEARVLAQMPASVRAAATQRERWEAGRYRLVRRRALPLLWQGIKARDARLCEAALSLLVPPLAELTALLMLWGGTVALGQLAHLLPGLLWWQGAVALAALGLLIYLVGGLSVAEASPDAYRALLGAPVYVAWKFAQYAWTILRRSSRSEGATPGWVRTARTPITRAR